MSPNSNTKQIKHNQRTWFNLFNLTIFSAYFYAFMEWVFFVTKPSSLSILTPLDTGTVLFITGGAVALPLVDILVLLFLLSRLVRNAKWRSLLLVAGKLVPALILTVTALIMLDNFTYTVFGYGIVSTAGIWRALYALGFGLCLWQTFRYVHRRVRKRGKNFASFLSLGLLTVSIGTFLVTSLTHDSNLGDLNAGQVGTVTNRPNIIILGSDGLSASYLSAYGYTHDTAPFLSQIMENSLVAENAFPNASSTTASTASVLTGKEAAEVKVYRYPDILSGRDSFEHLPGILKQYGYKTIEIGTPFYVDAQKLNLVKGFDVVNNQSMDLPAQDLFRNVLGNTPSTYFIWTILDRARERLLHIFFIKEMPNPLEEVNNPKFRMSDEQKVDQIIDILDQADRPVFIFVHLMDTHGPTFSSSKSASESSIDTEAPWDKTLYEAAIQNFDNHLENIYNHLSQTGELDNTVLAIYTDHGFKYVINQRIPIILHFPQNEYAGTRANNVQIIDIPVTLLDYLGIPKPAWMMGTSLLNSEPPAERHITSITAGSPRKIAPPFYQIKIVQVIVCQKWYALNVQVNKWNSGDVYQHTTHCEEDHLPSDDEIHQEILDYLEKHGYDISSLQ